MKVYEVLFDEANDKGVYALSCVENPAMEDMWLTLSDHPKEIQFSAVNEEKRLLLGAALIPNKKVYRNMNGEEFYITFPESTIEACAHSFIKNGYQNNSSIDHDIKLEGVSVVQSWIVQDPNNDKSNAFGKTYEKGTWVTMMKVENEEAWQKAKNGELQGFSIDGLFSLKEINLNKQENMNDNKSIVDAIKEGFALAFSKKEKEVKLGQLKLKDGKTVVEFEGDAPEVGMPVFVLSEDKEEKFTAPEGVIELESGEVLNIDKNGLLMDAAEVKEVVEEPKEDVTAQLKEMFTELSLKMDEKVNALEEKFNVQLEAEKQKNVELEAKLSAEPAEDKIVKKTIVLKEAKTAKERLFNKILENK